MIEGLKRLGQMIFRRNPYRLFGLPLTRVDYKGKVGDGTGSSTVAAVVNWVTRTFPEAPPAMWRELDNGQRQQVRNHPLLRLLQRPNGFYTGMILWAATVTDWMVDGNAYWLKVRDRGGQVVELWWVPHWMIEPKGDDETFITHYEYRPGSEPLGVATDDVVHFRFGLDPEDSRKGRSQLKSVLREVFTDDEAAQFTASLLSNMGVPGLMVSPEKGVSITEDQAVEAKQSLLERFTSDRRGEPIVMTGATKIEQFGFSPEQLMLRELRRIPEERVSAVTGIPAVVAGLGAGLDRSTFTNMGEAREAAYEAGLIPMQRFMAEDVRFQLLTDFESDPFEWMFGFDLAQVRVLQEDLYRQAQRVGLAIRDGYGIVSEARRLMGLEVDADRDNIFLRPANMTMVDATPGSDGAMTSLAPARANGNGQAHYPSPEEYAAAVMAAMERRELTAAT